MTDYIRIAYVVVFRAVYNLSICWTAGLVAEIVKRWIGGRL